MKKNTILIIASIIFTLVLTDVVLYFSHYRYLIGKFVHPQFYYQKDEEIGFDIKPNFATTTHIFSDGEYPIWSNSLGCFDEEYKGEIPYIYLTGDSFTWGFAPFENKWGTILEKELNIRVLKCGVTGYGTREEVIKTTRHLGKLPLPELIIVGYTEGNDIIDNINFPAGTVQNGYLMRNLAKNGVTKEEAEIKYDLLDRYCTSVPPKYPILQKVKCWLHNYSVLYNVAGKIRSYFSVSENQDSIEKDSFSEEEYNTHLEDIRKFKLLADQKGVKLLFVLIQGDTKELKFFLGKERISYIDLETLNDKSFRWGIDGHWNIEGNRIAGEKVAKFITDFLDIK